jgi:predicted RND superfamily exporter protein
MMNQIWGGGGVDDLKLPANRVLVELFAVALRSADFPFVTTLADPDFRIAYLVLRTRDMPAERYLSLVKEIVTYAENAKPPGVSVSAAKGIHSILEADQRIVRSQLSSVGSSILLIGLVLGILWRSPRFALLSLISNVVPVGAVVALTGFLEIPLNSITVMVAAVTFGMAIEDSVHFITFWREKRKQSLSIDDAIAESLRVKGRAMIATSVALICLFSIFALSSFPPVVHFGLLSAAAFSAALVSVLVLLPALLRLSETPRLPRPLGREGQGEGE